MNQAELIAKVADEVELNKAEAGRMVEAVLSAVAASLKAGEKVSLQSLGVFDITDRAARQGRNPATGESIQIAASKAVKFRPTKSLKEAISPPPAARSKPTKAAPKKAPAKKAAAKA